MIAELTRRGEPTPTELPPLEETAELIPAETIAQPPQTVEGVNLDWVKLIEEGMVVKEGRARKLSRLEGGSLESELKYLKTKVGWRFVLRRSVASCVGRSNGERPWRRNQQGTTP